MTGTVMLLYRDPNISPQIWNCSLILASVSAAALFKVTAYCVVAVRPLLGHLRFVLAVLVYVMIVRCDVAGCVSTVLRPVQRLPDGILPLRSRSVSVFITSTNNNLDIRLDKVVNSIGLLQAYVLSRGVEKVW